MSMHWLVAIVLSVCVSSCVATRSATEGKTPVKITCSNEFGFVNVTFAIRAKETITAQDGSLAHVFHFGGDFEGQTVHAAIALSSEWDERRDGLSIPTYWSDIGIYPTDSEGLGILAVLKSCYEIKNVVHTKQLEAVNARVVAFDARPRDVLNNAAHLKVFFGPPLHPEYAEFYLNIDPSRGTVQLNEKAPEYRTAVLRGFTEAP